MQKHSREPTAPANGECHHENLQFMGLKEKQHLGRNYCNLKGGYRPACTSKIWKQCLIFFLSDLYSAHETVVWTSRCSKQHCQKGVILQAFSFLQQSFAEHLLRASCCTLYRHFSVPMGLAGCWGHRAPYSLPSKHARAMPAPALL